MRTSWSTTPRDSPRGPGPADSPVGARQHIPRSGSAFSATSPLSDLASLTVGTLSRSSLNGAGAPMRSPRGGSSANSPHVPTHAHSASEAPGGAPSPALRDHGGDPSPKRTEEDLLDRSKPAEAPSPRGHATDPFPAVPPPAHAGQAHADDSDPFGGLFGAFPAEPRPAAAAVAGAGPSGRPPEEAGKAVPRCDHGSDLIPGFGAATADQPVVTHRTAADSAPTAAAAPALSTTSRTREAHTSAVRAPEPAATSPTSPAAASQRPHSHDGPRGGQQGAVLGAASTGTRVMSGAGAGVPNRGADTPGAGAGTHNRGEHIPIAGAGTASGPRSQGAVGAGRVATGGQFWEQMPRRDPMGSSMGAPAAGYGGGNPAGALRSEVVGGRAVGGEDRNVARCIWRGLYRECVSAESCLG